MDIIEAHSLTIEYFSNSLSQFRNKNKVRYLSLGLIFDILDSSEYGSYLIINRDLIRFTLCRLSRLGILTEKNGLTVLHRQPFEELLNK